MSSVQTVPPEVHERFLARVEGLVTVTTGGQTSRYVPAETYLALLDECNELRRALAMVSAARIPGSGIDADAVLDRAGETLDQARTNAGIIASIRGSRRP